MLDVTLPAAGRSSSPVVPRFSRTRTGTGRVRVVVGDTQPLYRDAMALAVKFRPDLELVGQTRGGTDTVAAIRELSPDVAVIDFSLAGSHGREVLDAVVAGALPTRVLFLSARLDPALAYEAIESGAAGCLSKNAEAQHICDAIAAVARGETVLAPQAQTYLADEIRTRRRGVRPLLTDREQQVLELVAEGRSARAIAAHLHLGVGTVKSHLLHIYDKLGVSERAAAVAEAMRRGLLR
ncbi:MAG TPA: response regulator transcription factor [Baekduia sp.]|nr:response regulator transcription factor [Baekduia sp.]